jgi:hypothetical protein
MHHHRRAQAAKHLNNGVRPQYFLLQHRIQCYKQINMKNLLEERKIVSYLPLGLVDMTVCPVVVHRRLALSVLPILL